MQVIIVSNRLPVSVKKVDGNLVFSPSVGGLATGLSSYVSGKNNTWIGWPGIASDELTKKDRAEIITELAKHHCSPVFLTQKQIDNFYNGYSNTVLWPLFHELRAQDRPGERRERWYRTYREVNRLFAETVEVAAQDGAYVWVHDYQLLLVPSMLRDMDIAATLGFFLHIPFPRLQKFMALPDARKIIKGMLGADLIGFHTVEYGQNFLQAAEQSGYESRAHSVRLQERAVRVANFPMGIDYDKYASSGRSNVVKRATKQYQQQYKGKKVIVAVDRLDPSKGLLERLDAYGEFLERYPQQRRKVVFAMVASPSRTDIPAYKRLARRMEATVSEINATYGDDEWTPIDYINYTLPFEHVTALFQVADVAFIAPLRDGMNLAAKEFVASTHKNSVLILSETAGASQELHDALIVDPRRPETVVAALYDSLTMKRPELRGRLRRMKQHLKVHTVHAWAKDFVGTLNKPLAMPQSPVGVNRLEPETVTKDYAAAKKRLLLLDYDGTLVPFHDNPAKVKPSKALLKTLDSLTRDPSTDVVIVSGRSIGDLMERFGKLPVNLIAEHGASSRRAGQSSWRTQGNASAKWQNALVPILERYAALTPSAHVEVKAYSLVWHYRSSPPYYAHKYLTIIKRTLRHFLKENGLVIQKGNKVLEIKDPTITKGTAVRPWLNERYDFVLVAGDDMTDEDMFKEVPDASYSVKVGRGPTAARYRVTSCEDIQALLAALAKTDPS